MPSANGNAQTSAIELLAQIPGLLALHSKVCCSVSRSFNGALNRNFIFFRSCACLDFFDNIANSLPQFVLPQYDFFNLSVQLHNINLFPCIFRLYIGGNRKVIVVFVLLPGHILSHAFKNADSP